MPQTDTTSDCPASPFKGAPGPDARSASSAATGEGIDALYDEHARSVFHYALAILGSRTEADDAVQGVFLEIVRRPGLLQGIHSPRTYLLTMARNWVHRYRQHTARRRVAEIEASEAQLLKARDPLVCDAEATAELERAILSLPEEQREVVVLKVFEGMTFREIGTVVSISENTAASRYRYALDKLREFLREKREV